MDEARVDGLDGPFFVWKVPIFAKEKPDRVERSGFRESIRCARQLVVPTSTF